MGIPAIELAEQGIAAYMDLVRQSNILPAHKYPRVTEELPTIIEMVQTLIRKGFAYETPGTGDNRDVYFRVSRKPDYGKLSHRDLESLLAGARIEPGEHKESPADFALWKSAKPGEPAWESPWGQGRPGWHIECSAMALKYLGDPLDIHGGGLDLVFPHHENEIAQSEAYTGREPFARFWVHNGLLQFDGEKMSKSVGNIVTWRQALEAYGADALRLFVLGSHYRSPLTYSEESMAAAKRGAERLVNAVSRTAPVSGGEAVDPAPFKERFIAMMENDFNTAGALAQLFELATEINRGADEGRAIAAAQATLRELAGVLGLTLSQATEDHMAAAPFIDLLLEIRSQLRAAKQYALADTVRNRLRDLNIIVEDTPQGPVWKPRRS
jgi:cysteinyl-tRNA synthetase